MPSYHDFHITLEDMERSSITSLPFNVYVMCTRVGGWEIWHRPDGPKAEAALLAGEFDEKKVRLDIAGTVIFDNLSDHEPT